MAFTETVHWVCPTFYLSEIVGINIIPFIFVGFNFKMALKFSTRGQAAVAEWLARWLHHLKQAGSNPASPKSKNELEKSTGCRKTLI